MEKVNNFNEFNALKNEAVKNRRLKKTNLLLHQDVIKAAAENGKLEYMLAEDYLLFIILITATTVYTEATDRYLTL